MELVCSVQEYAWGKQGSSSQVARFAPKACPPFSAVETTPYAELWMGTHPNGPARLATTGQLLSDLVTSKPELLGEESRAKFGDKLPFLFKVLSVGKALSIQAHPDLPHAQQLHKERPEVYKDPNHKPEIAIALTDFEGLCGFRPLQEIQGFIASVPEFAAVLGDCGNQLVNASESNYRDQLKAAFEALMLCDKEKIASQLTTLLNRLSTEANLDPVSLLFQRLHGQYPGDVGCFVIYFLNVLKLVPGESMFLGPNIPHAYLAGDCVECMANSDNVVRAGLTPKLIDTPTLVAMLDYTCSPADTRIFGPSQGPSSACTQFHPPVPDFAVSRHNVANGSDYTLPARSSASIILVTEGQGDQESEGNKCSVSPGSVLFIPANATSKVTCSQTTRMVASVKLDRGSGTECTVSLHGATLTSWKVKGEELIFVSPKAILDGTKAIRGGVPVCFPAFGPWPLGPQHGFARTSTWKQDGEISTDESGDVSCVLVLEPGPHSAAWPHSFCLSLKVHLSESGLTLTLGVENKNPDKPFDFTTALHTYFKVPEVSLASIKGLQGLKFVDKTVEGTPTLEEARDEVTLSGWTDRVYLGGGQREVNVNRGPGAGSITLTSTGLSDAVVWNPWPEKAEAMADLGGEASKSFICVEAGQCVDPIKVAAKQKWTGTHKLIFSPA